MKKHYLQLTLIGLKNLFVLNRTTRTGIWIALLFFMPLVIFAQKGTKDIIVRACVEDIGNGMYRVNFGYDNPNTKDVLVTEDKSFVKKNGKKLLNGTQTFKKGSVNRLLQLNFPKQNRWNGR